MAIQTDENGKVTGLVVQPQVIGEVRGGRPAPRDADQPQEVIPCDVVLMAVGQAVDSKDLPGGVPVSRNNIVAADDGSVPGMEGVFSGGGLRLRPGHGDFGCGCRQGGCRQY